MSYVLPSIVAATGWGIIPMMDRYTSKYLTGMVLASARGVVYGVCAFSLLVFLTGLFKSKSDQFKDVFKRKDRNFIIMLLILSPIIGFTLGHLGFYVALSKSRDSVIQVVLISHCGALLITALLAWLIYNDEINIQMIIGIILSLLGIFMTVYYNPNYIKN